MKRELYRYISIEDIIFNWIVHWKSLVILVGVYFVFVILFFINIGTNRITTMKHYGLSDTQKAISALKEKKLADLADLYIEYSDIAASLREKHDSLSVIERAEALFYLTTSQSTIEKMIGELNEEDASTLYNFVSSGHSIAEVDEAVKNIEVDLEAAVVSPKKITMGMLLLVTLHFLVVFLLFISNDAIKPSDNVGAFLGVPEYYWNNYSDDVSKRGIDKLLLLYQTRKYKNKYKASAPRRNADITISVMKKKHLRNVVLIGLGIDREKGLLRDFFEGEGITIRMADGVYSAEDLKKIDDSSAAILLARIGMTRYSELETELSLLKEYNGCIDVLGVMLFEG